MKKNIVVLLILLSAQYLCAQHETNLYFEACNPEDKTYIITGSDSVTIEQIMKKEIIPVEFVKLLDTDTLNVMFGGYVKIKNRDNDGFMEITAGSKERRMPIEVIQERIAENSKPSAKIRKRFADLLEAMKKESRVSELCMIFKGGDKIRDEKDIINILAAMALFCLDENQNTDSIDIKITNCDTTYSHEGVEFVCPIISITNKSTQKLKFFIKYTHSGIISKQREILPESVYSDYLFDMQVYKGVTKKTWDNKVSDIIIFACPASEWDVDTNDVKKYLNNNQNSNNVVDDKAVREKIIEMLNSGVVNQMIYVKKGLK